MPPSIVIDTSAVIALLLEEPNAEQIAITLAEAETIRVASPNLLEMSIVAVSKRGEEGYAKLRNLLERLNVVTIACDDAIVEIAFEAWKRYGKGRHPASLNFGDCFAYALAKQRAEPLLFKGEDFSQTDILSALNSVESEIKEPP